MEQVYLKKKDDTRAIIPPDSLWLYTDILAQRSDMEVYQPSTTEDVIPEPLAIPSLKDVLTDEQTAQLEMEKGESDTPTGIKDRLKRFKFR